MARKPSLLIRALLVLTAGTALLPLVLHYLLTGTGMANKKKGSHVWTGSVAEIVASPPWTLFYHMYFPPNDDLGYQHTVSLVEEQLGLVGQSYATKARDNHYHPTLYYTVIGDAIRNDTWMQELCRRNHLRCIQLQHMTAGHEDVTLQALYSFCHASFISPHQAVIYLHTKGSFHASGPQFATQDVWRQRLTQAATDQQCLRAVVDHDESSNTTRCETCSLLLQPLPGIHYPGNMWTASCRHIRRLLPPVEFAHRMDVLVHDFVLVRSATERLNTTFFAQMPHMMGRLRFAAEHWLGSHPELRYPCDLSAGVTANMSQWLHPEEEYASNNHHASLSPSDFTLGQWPTFPIDHAHWDFYRYGKRGCIVLETPALRLRDYFLLPGQLFKFSRLYGTIPPADSWIWQWFPDATLWQRLWRQYGHDLWNIDTPVDDWLPPVVPLVV